MGRVWKTTLPDNTSVTNEFFATGLLKKSSGSRTYPVEYTYDFAGRMKTMKTWQGFAANSGAAVTTWNYNQYRGWLDNKRYDDNTGPNYTYTAAGRLASGEATGQAAGNPNSTAMDWAKAGLQDGLRAAGIAGAVAGPASRGVNAAAKALGAEGAAAAGAGTATAAETAAPAVDDAVKALADAAKKAKDCPPKLSKVKKSKTTEDIGGKYTKTTEVRPGNGPGQSRAEYVRYKDKDGNVIRTYKDSYDRANNFQGRKPLRGGPEGRPQN